MIVTRARRAAVVFTSALLLAACGGGSSDGQASGPADGNTAVAETGTLIDSPVAGIGYRTQTQSGVTDANGNYRYLPGETVTFFVGNVTLPPVPAKGTVTPFDLANSSDTNHQIALNIAAFLQSLDSDANPANGITIPEQAAGLATGGIDFNVPASSFGQNTNLRNLVRDANPGARLPVDADTARDHLLSTVRNLPATGKGALAPTARASATPASAQVGQTIVLLSEGSEDLNGDALQYQWGIVSKPDGSQAALSSVSDAQTMLTVDVAGTYTIGLTVNDGTLASAASTVSVAVSNPPPAATLSTLSTTMLPVAMAVGGTHALNAVATYSDGATADVTTQVTWTSSAPGIATVDAHTGLVTAVAVGSAQIGASLNGVHAAPGTVDVLALAAPTLHRPVSGAGTVSLSWTPVANATSYNLYWAENTPGISSGSNRIENVQPGYQHSGLTGGKAYFYRVAAVLGNAEMPSNEVFSFVYGAGQPSGTFSLAAPLPSRRDDSAPTLLNNGKILLVGHLGDNTLPALLFDPSNNTYEQVASPTGRLWGKSTATELLNGKVLIAGGHIFQSTGMGLIEELTDETYLYDPTTNSIISGPPFPAPVYDHSAVRLADGRVFFTGGQTNGGRSASSHFYDPVTNAFTSGPDMASVRIGHQSIALRDGRVFIFGGQNANGFDASATLYDPATNSFASAGSTAVTTNEVRAVELGDGRILIAGNVLPSGLIQQRAQIFDPTNDSITNATAPTLRHRDGALARLPDGRALYAGGNTGSPVLGGEVFDPVTLSFSTTGSLISAVNWASAVTAHDGRVYFFGWTLAVNVYGP
ncbi:MAG: kelch repeat-containing protein [Burkholderiaceae bacterium]